MAARGTVLIVEDHLPSFLCIRHLLESRRLGRCVGFAPTLAEGISLCRKLKPNLVILDLGLPDGNGLDMLKTLPPPPRRPRVLVISGNTDAATLINSEQAAISGFVEKGAPLDQWIDAIRAVGDGGCYDTPWVRAERQRIRRDPLFWRKLLSTRQEALIRLIATGTTVDGAAERLSIKRRSVTTALNRICKILDLGSAIEIPAWAMRQGVADARPINRVPPQLSAVAMVKMGEYRTAYSGE